jgi:hypothetical protein
MLPMISIGLRYGKTGAAFGVNMPEFVKVVKCPKCGFTYETDQPRTIMVDCVYCRYGFIPALNTVQDTPHPKGEVKFDEGKPQIDLIPAELLFVLGEIMGKGSLKHGARNWEQGGRWGGFFAPAMRHAWKFWMNRDRDQQLHTYHLGMAIFNLMVLLVYSMRGIGDDDRTEYVGDYSEDDNELFRD